MGRTNVTRSARRRALREGVVTPSAKKSPRWLLPGLLALLVLGAGAALWFVQLSGKPTSVVAVLQTADFHSLAFSPSDPNTVFFGHHNGVMRSSDGGRTWRSVVDKPNFDAMALSVNPLDGNQVYLSGHNIFQVSNDGGNSWKPLQNNLPGTDIHGFAMSPADPQHHYAFVVGSGLFQSTDGGQKWQPFGGRVPMDVMTIAAGGGSPEALYATSMQSGLLRSIDAGQTWAPVKNFGSDMAYSVAVDPLEPQTVYAGLSGGIEKSTDGGATWTRLPSPAKNVVVLGVSPAQKDLVLAIGVDGPQGNTRGLVYRSSDGGQTW